MYSGGLRLFHSVFSRLRQAVVLKSIIEYSASGSQAKDTMISGHSWNSNVLRSVCPVCLAKDLFISILFRDVFPVKFTSVE